MTAGDGLQSLRSILSSIDALLFDFDGPLCDVFSGAPAPVIARELEAVASDSFTTDDPLEVLRQAYLRLPSSVARDVEDALVLAELAAVQVAAAEPSGVAALRASAELGLLVGVVTNNDAAAADWFLRSAGVEDLVSVTVGRPFRQPELMKPDPWPVLETLRRVGVPPVRAALIGDSMTDVEACHAGGVRCIALANKPGKRTAFESAGAAVVVDDMGELLRALADSVDADSRR